MMINNSYLSKSDSDLIKQHLLSKTIESLFSKYSKIEKIATLNELNLKNKFLYKEIEYIITKQNKLLFHFQLGLFFIIISIIINIIVLCYIIF